MSISLKKGGTINLTKKQPGLKKIMIGLGWEVLPGNSLDLDASVFMVGNNQKLLSDEYFVFYNNLKSPDGSVQHTGDNRTGAGDGDDEMILANLDLIHPNVTEILIMATIHEPAAQSCHFGMLQEAYIRIVDVERDVEILHYDLDESNPNENAMEFGRLKRVGDEWNFVASGIGSSNGLQGYVDTYA